MCGRYALTLSPERFREFFQYVEQPNFPPRYNIAPTQPVPVVVEESGARHFRLMRWGFLPEWVKDPTQYPLVINARAESLVSKPSFKAAIRYRRCIFLADGFYEWRRGASPKQPFLVRMRSREPMPMAGLWETYSDPDGGEIDTAAIVTTAANPAMSAIHERMPAILDQAGVEKWLSISNCPVGDALEVARPCPESWLDMIPVSTRLNNAREDDAELQTEVPPLEEKSGLVRKATAKNPAQGSLF